VIPKGNTEVAMKDDVGDPLHIALIPGAVKAKLMAQGNHIFLRYHHTLGPQIQGASIGVIARRQLDGDEDDDRQGCQHDDHDDEALEKISCHLASFQLPLCWQFNCQHSRELSVISKLIHWDRASEELISIIQRAGACREAPARCVENDSRRRVNSLSFAYLKNH
jgi:hypothetical protein